VVIVSDGSLSDHQEWVVTVSGDTPEIDIQCPPGTSIPDGGTLDLGEQPTGSYMLSCTIDNSLGTAPLEITGITASNHNNTTDFSVDASLPFSVSAGSSATFDLSFSIVSSGSFSLDIDIANNDNNENPYDMTIQGTGTPPELPSFYFSSTSYSVNENAGTTAIQLILSAPATGTERVYFDQVPGTATTDDYTPSFGYANFFTPGQTVMDLPIPITNDTLQEGDESFTVTLSSPIDSQLGTPSTAQVTIIDDDIVPVENDDIDNAIEITTFPYANTQDITNATTASDDPVLPCAGNQKVQSVWYQFTPITNGTVTIDTAGSNYETTIALWAGSRGSLTNHGCIYVDPLSVPVTAGTSAGTTYYIEIASWDAPSNPRTLELDVNFSPTASGEISVKNDDNGVEIPDGDNTPSTNEGTDFGSVDINGVTATQWFRIWNDGTDYLYLTGDPNKVDKVEVTGCSDFTITTQPGQPGHNAISPNHNSVQFLVTYDPSTVGTCTAEISIPNSDSDENPYNFTIEGNGTDSGIYPLVEEFISSEGFTSTDPDIYISNGKAYWHVYRDGGEQYIYRSIPEFSGPVRITVVGQVDYAANNCHVQAGIGNALGDGVEATFGYMGGGCPVQDYLINAGGVSLDRAPHLCTSVDATDWLWVNNSTQYTATLTVSDSVLLDVAGVGQLSGSPSYSDLYNMLYVGLTGGGDWPDCSGSIESGRWRSSNLFWRPRKSNFFCFFPKTLST